MMFHSLSVLTKGMLLTPSISNIDNNNKCFINPINIRYLLALVTDVFAHSKCFLFSITLSTQRPAQMSTDISQLSLLAWLIIINEVTLNIKDLTKFL